MGENISSLFSSWHNRLLVVGYRGAVLSWLTGDTGMQGEMQGRMWEALMGSWWLRAELEHAAGGDLNDQIRHGSVAISQSLHKQRHKTVPAARS